MAGCCVDHFSGDHNDSLFLSDPGPIIALPCKSVALLKFCSDWKCQSCYMDFSKFVDGFVKVVVFL